MDIVLINFLIGLHLGTVLTAAALGVGIFIIRKGTVTHRALGRAYVSLLIVTAVVALAIPASTGPQWLSHFGWLHLLSVVTLVALWHAVRAIRRGRRQVHARTMVWLYVGGIIVPGALALGIPGRLLHSWLFG